MTTLPSVINGTKILVDYSKIGEKYIRLEFPWRPDDRTRILIKSLGFTWKHLSGHWVTSLVNSEGTTFQASLVDVLTSATEYVPKPKRDKHLEWLAKQDVEALIIILNNLKPNYKWVLPEKTHVAPKNEFPKLPPLTDEQIAEAKARGTRVD